VTRRHHGFSQDGWTPHPVDTFSYAGPDALD
jgi:hypothetical protein